MDAATLKQKKQALGYLKEEYSNLRDKISHLRMEITMAEAKYAVGDEVTYKRGGKICRGRVKSIEGESCDRTVYCIIPTLSSGRDGKPVNIIDWHYSDMKPAD